MQQPWHHKRLTQSPKLPLSLLLHRLVRAPCRCAHANPWHAAAAEASYPQKIIYALSQLPIVMHQQSLQGLWAHPIQA
jgi:hypothetical protein